MKETANEHGWLDLLRKWLSGDATHHDEAEMETRARSDEFLAEAIEGYREFPDDDHQWHLDNIRERLFRQKKKRTPLLIYLPRVAAAVLVLAAAWWLLTPLLSPDGAELAQAEETLTEQIRKEADLKTNEAEEFFPSEHEALRIEDEALTESTVPPSENEDTQNAAADEPLPDESIADNAGAPARRTPETTLLPPAAANVEDQTDTAAPALSTEEMVTLDAPVEIEIKGRVLDADSGDPLIAAAVQVMGTDAGTVTDVDGSFTVSVPEKNARLLVSYTGYQTEEVLVNQERAITVRLQPAADELSEVVVSGMKAAKKTKRIASASQVVPGHSPEPKGGWKKWERYLRRKLKYPSEARSKGITGVVSLRFKVGEDGKPSDITVVKSLGSGCDEEAIRLLKNGPKWQPPGPASVSIRFE